jgi:hypothetical protein
LLRNLAKRTACLQFFADEGVDIEQRAKQALKEAGVDIEPDALRLFVGDLPGHRMAANSEIEKLALYARGLGRSVSEADIRALCATEFEQTLSQRSPPRSMATRPPPMQHSKNSQWPVPQVSASCDPFSLRCAACWTRMSGSKKASPART